jgi:hypothetical protein
MHLHRTLSSVGLACALIAMPALLITHTGCATRQNVAQGSDVFVVNAEQSQQMAFELVDSFLAFEKANRHELWQLSPEIKRAADKLRLEYPAANQSLKDSIRVYKATRSEDHKITVNTWLAIVDQAKLEAGKWLAHANPTP